jgi:short-subunit dehydrogenase
MNHQPTTNDQPIAGRRVLVTGASGGLGAAIARHLHACGAKLVLSARNVEALESLRDELDHEPELIAADLCDQEAVNHLLQTAAPIDILIANAGLPASGRLDSFSNEQIERALQVNLYAPITLARGLSGQMVERGFGHLVFISSLSGKVAGPGSSIYSATKFGLRGFAFSVREELRGSGVGVTTVFPSFIGSAGMWAEAGIDLPPGIALRYPDDVAKAVIKGIQTGQAEIDVAPASLRVGALAAGVAPGLVAWLNRRLGSAGVADALGEAQQHKR